MSSGRAGGLREMDTTVLPGTTHMAATKRLDLLVPPLAAFLD
jgi:hypothetical protein